MHQVNQNALDVRHRLCVVLVGCGGTGSAVLSGLARLHQGLLGWGLPGLYVVAVDPDKVSVSNLGRQCFGESDLGMHKASVLVTRVNRLYGTDWEAYPVYLSEDQDIRAAHTAMMITCVDSVASRLAAHAWLRHKADSNGHHYWLDFGNSRESGQVILGTVDGISRRHDYNESMGDMSAWREALGVKILPTVLDLYPDMAAQEELDEPSCSARESLLKQDLFINSILADLGLNIVWRLLTRGVIDVHGAFVDLARSETRPLRVDREVWAAMGWEPNGGTDGKAEKSGE